MKMLCRRSSVVEQLFCKQQVVSSNLTVGSKKIVKDSSRARRGQEIASRFSRCLWIHRKNSTDKKKAGWRNQRSLQRSRPGEIWYWFVVMGEPNTPPHVSALRASSRPCRYWIYHQVSDLMWPVLNPVFCNWTDRESTKPSGPQTKAISKVEASNWFNMSALILPENPSVEWLDAPDIV